MKTILLAGLVVISGCTMQADVAEESKRRVAHCVDTRDGESFVFRGDKITNVRVGIGADSCFDVVDEAGKKRTLCKSHEQWIKCGEVQRKEWLSKS